MDRILEIFTNARELPDGAERDAYLQLACEGDTQLRDEVISLIRASESTKSFLSMDGSGQPQASPEDLIGETISRYKLIDILGEGGFGDVYLVEQSEPVRRQLAMKIIKPGLCQKDVLKRFMAELEALSLMDHPNIISILDTGTTNDDRPYFLMNMVIGEPITKYCEKWNLPLRERLKLFKVVCSAVEHAHQRGVLHRDLKPSNIVIVEQDGSPVPKIIDFGIAKVLQRDQQELTMVTQIGFFVGTPMYMSPEQISQSSATLDTRSDVYALGIVLYELITGITPFDTETLKRAALIEVQRIICEHETELPSTRIRKLINENEMRAGTQVSNSKRLARSVHGDLDWIVMKAIEKDRVRRYPGVGELARDIDRHLKNQPIEAGDPGIVYRIRKFARRRKVAASLIATALPLVLISAAITIVSYYQIKHERDLAIAAEMIAEMEVVMADAMRQRLINDYRAPARESKWSPDANGSLVFPEEGSKAVEIALQDFANKVETELRAIPDLEIRARRLLADSYISANLQSLAQQELRKVIDLNERQYGSNSIQYADSLVSYAYSLNSLHQLKYTYDIDVNMDIRATGGKSVKRSLILPLLEEAIAIYRDRNHASSMVLQCLLDLYWFAPLKHYEQKEALIREAIAVWKKMDGDKDYLYSILYPKLADQLISTGNDREGKEIWMRVLAYYRASRDGPNWIGPRIWTGLAKLFETEGNLEAAEELYRIHLHKLDQAYHGRFTNQHRLAMTKLQRVLKAAGNADPQLEENIRQIDFEQALNPALSRASYEVSITEPGTYLLFTKWMPTGGGSGSFYSRIDSIEDGSGGEIADLYGFSGKGTSNRANTPTGWDFYAFFETVNGDIGGPKEPVKWYFPKAGTYRLQFIDVNPGTAIDAFVLQKEDLPIPDEDFDENQVSPGRIYMEAEACREIQEGLNTVWSKILDPDPDNAEVAAYSGEGYLVSTPLERSVDAFSGSQ